MKVSVIVPVYNAQAYLKECLDSILASTLKEIEVIAVDDGSTDDSAQILSAYEKRGLRVIHQQNGGPAKARNAGLREARGEYVGFVDADDWIEPDMFEQMYLQAKQHEADIVWCNIFRNESEKMRRYLPSGPYDRDAIVREIFPLLIGNTDERSGTVVLRGSTCIRIFRRILLNDHQIQFVENLMYNEDGFFCIQATLAAQCYVYMGESYLYHNRYVPVSLTRRYVPELWKRQRAMVDMLKDKTLSSEYDFARQISKKALDIAIYCAENECKQSSPFSGGEQMKRLKEICKDEVLRRELRLIDWRRMKRINQAYFWAFRLKMTLAVRAIALKRQKMQMRSRNHG